jgi:hypothetical protein
MSWAVGEGKDGRDVGYGVPALCDLPGCDKRIDRGLSHVCGMINTDGEDRGCGLHFCTEHLLYSRKYESQFCPHCWPRRRKALVRKPDLPEWVEHKMTDPSWARWRQENGMAP